MALAGDARPGNVVVLDNKYYVVVSFQHSKLGRRGAYVKLKIKSLDTGNVLEKTFSPDEEIEIVPLYRKEGTVMYIEENEVAFMDTETFEQFSLPKDQLGDLVYYLKEGSPVHLLFHENRLVSVEVPTFVELEVVETDPGVRGDTEGSASKPAKLETGLIVQVPLFVQIGDIVKIDTRDGSYVERVKK